ncbi:MAG: uracil-DNA glycosylase [Brevinemataceae bacterium]
MNKINIKIAQVFADEYTADASLYSEEKAPINNTVKQSETPPKNPVPVAKSADTTQTAVPPEDPRLLEIYHKCLECRACDLCSSALNLVFGDGNADSNLMIIGEAPGADEDAQGKPFVGKAGQLLIKTLKKYGLERDEIYIANILKHRPPNNRNPLPQEINACTPFLKEQIAIIKPKLILTLGNFASQFILDTKMGITKIRGSIQESSFGMVMPTLHPSAIIRGAFPVEWFETDIAKALQFAGYDIDTEGGN